MTAYAEVAVLFRLIVFTVEKVEVNIFVLLN